MKRSVLESDVILTAIRWWDGHRPVNWTLQQHIENPVINAGYSQGAKELADAVGALVKAQRHGASRGRSR